jgi:transcription initiation factor TFIIIB Brf1 subunit/transcription initiation factor TFIIB
MHAVEIIRRMLANGIYIQRMLGGRGLVGLALIEAYYADCAWQTIQQIAHKSTMSEDTVRRRLMSLIKANRAVEKVEDGRKLYAIKPATARQIMKRVCEHEKAPVVVPD